MFGFSFYTDTTKESFWEHLRFSKGEVTSDTGKCQKTSDTQYKRGGYSVIRLANFRRIFAKDINSIYLTKIKVSVELNITELLMCCTFVSDGKESACHAGGMGQVPGLGLSPSKRNGNPFQYSCLENSMGRGTLWATFHGVTKSQTRMTNTFTFNVISQIMKCGSILLWKNVFLYHYSSKFY